jgi:hypothetical protein
MEGEARMVAEMGTGLYGAYQAGSRVYPYIRAGIQALAAL